MGFPGETEEQFQATVRAMRELEFDFAYIARYSSRSGTIATDKFGDDISHEEKARRLEYSQLTVARKCSKTRQIDDWTNGRSAYFWARKGRNTCWAHAKF